MSASICPTCGQVSNNSPHEIQTDVFYPDSYKGPKCIEEQVELLMEVFPDLDPGPPLNYWEEMSDRMIGSAPYWVEGMFVLVNQPAVVDRYFQNIPAEEEYNHCVRKIADSIGATNVCDQKGHFVKRNYAHTEVILHRLSNIMHTADFLVLPCQLGKRFSGKSVYQVRQKIQAGADGTDSRYHKMYGFGLLEALSVAITHPELFAARGFGIDCPSDAIIIETEGKEEKVYSTTLSCAKQAGVPDPKLTIGSSDVCIKDPRNGSATFFVPY